MSASLKPFVALAMLFATSGQFVTSASSVRAEDAAPVAVDLVELAVTLPDVVSRARFLDVELAEATRLNERGVSSHSEVRRLRAESEAAQQKLELLRLVIQAEHDVATVRLKLARRQTAAAINPLDEPAAQWRMIVLKRMLDMAKEQAPDVDEEAASDAVKQP